MNHSTHDFTGGISWAFGLSTLIGLLAGTALLLFH